MRNRREDRFMISTPDFNCPGNCGHWRPSTRRRRQEMRGCMSPDPSWHATRARRTAASQLQTNKSPVKEGWKVFGAVAKADANITAEHRADPQGHARLAA